MIVEIKVPPADVFDEHLITRKALQKANLNSRSYHKIELLKRSLDARGKHPVFILQIKIHLIEPVPVIPYRSLIKPAKQGTVLIVGAGPAGYFSALELLEHGIKPIIIERGKDVQARRIDLRNIQVEGLVHPNSNYCFGEGGAGTYSDGKLYTRSHKRGDIRKILHLLVEHGASSDILIDAHPHIGSNKLPRVVKALRETILSHGGEILFNSLVSDFLIHNNSIVGVQINHESELKGDAVILATGHSARDIFYLLHKHHIRTESKPFALGVRLEHPQPLIDKIQYGMATREDNLPPSSYRLVCQMNGRGVFSFCMCPGGWIVPASTSPNELVVNGMSLSKRDNEFANSGMVVAIEQEDLQPFESHGIFAGLHFQQDLEQKAFQMVGDGTQRAPAQRMIDFISNKITTQVGPSSYIPGLSSANFHELLPPAISSRLKNALIYFGKIMPGYLTNEAQLIGIESRTSSPIRIPRNKDTFMHEHVGALFPVGEGAGYAGGIISAALDGQNAAKKVAAYLGYDALDG
jgi:hypothetical protein